MGRTSFAFVVLVRPSLNQTANREIKTMTYINDNKILMVDCADADHPKTKYVCWLDAQRMIEATRRALLLQPPTNPTTGEQLIVPTTPMAIKLHLMDDSHPCEKCQSFAYIEQNTDDLAVKLSELDGFYGVFNMKSNFYAESRVLNIWLMPLNGNTSPTLPPDWIEFVCDAFSGEEVVK